MTGKIECGAMPGNMSASEMEERPGIRLPGEDRARFDSRRQMKADDVQPGKRHCFDIPFRIVCGDKATGNDAPGILKRYEDGMTGTIGIGRQSAPPVRRGLPCCKRKS